MVFGHNSNVKLGETTYHVQTEDRGVTNALIDTTVHSQGRVLHRRTNNYLDLLPLDADREEALKLRVDEQHRNVMEEIRNGTLQLPVPVVAKRVAPPAAAPAAVAEIAPLVLTLTNAKDWLVGKRATLLVSVRRASGEIVPGARVTARMDGAAEAQEFTADTNETGDVHLEFDMPRLAGAEAALVIEAAENNVKGQLRFQLKAKPRTPAAN
ncbi:MAG TPA: hypothetical protein VK525_06395 [Candidatus Saccharimonadales bacterium]|nr:hypothetical protein [Candidatus Saccharimonadales bacterium]